MLDLFNKLNAKADADRLAVETEWRTVVAKVANDTATEAEIVNVLRATGRTLAELQSAVEREQRIAELCGIVATKSEAAHELERANEAASQFNRDRQIEHQRNREEGIRVHGEAYTARSNFDSIARAQRELDELLPPQPIERREVVTAYASTLPPTPIERPEIAASGDAITELANVLDFIASDDAGELAGLFASDADDVSELAIR